MDNRVITISRQCGSGGHTIGKMVAERMGIPLYDSNLVEMVAERSGLSRETVREQGEYASFSLLYSLAMNIASGHTLNEKGNMVLPDQINAFQTELIQELADKGPCVIIGHCADYVLRSRPDCLHVFISGSLEDRKKRVISEHNIAAAEAEAHVKDRDSKRARHYEHFTDQTWGMAKNYNLCLDSSYLGIERCVDLIVSGGIA